jgi:hypothetical protein
MDLLEKPTSSQSPLCLTCSRQPFMMMMSRVTSLLQIFAILKESFENHAFHVFPFKKVVP